MQREYRGTPAVGWLSYMPSTLVHFDAFEESLMPWAIDRLRHQLLARVEKRRQALASDAKLGWGNALDALARVHPLAAQTAQFHYLGGASLRSIALTTGREEMQCRDELRFARAWLARWLNQSVFPDETARGAEAIEPHESD